MSARNYYSAPASGSAATAIPATIYAHRVRIEEDAATPQGLVVTFAADGFTQPYTYAAGDAVELEGHGHDGALGAPGDDYARVASATSTATHVRVTEFEQ